MSVYAARYESGEVYVAEKLEFPGCLPVSSQVRFERLLVYGAEIIIPQFLRSRTTTRYKNNILERWYTVCFHLCMYNVLYQA